MPPSAEKRRKSLEKVTVVPGMSPFLQRNGSFRANEIAQAQTGGSTKYKHVIEDAENNVARLAGVMQNAELELEKAFRRTGDVQKGYTNQLENQTEELKKIIVSKQAQITYLEDKAGNMKQKYGEKLSDAQTKISTLEQELRRYKHQQVQERNKIVEKLKSDISGLNMQVSQLKQSKIQLERQMKHLYNENCTLKKRSESDSAAAAAAAVLGNKTRQGQRNEIELSQELSQCKQQLQLERNRSMKLQRKLHRLREKKTQGEVSAKYRQLAEIRLPYKEQLMKENQMLRDQLLSSHASRQQALEKNHMAWMHKALNSGEFNGSVCGNGWANDYKDLFYL